MRVLQTTLLFSFFLFSAAPLSAQVDFREETIYFLLTTRFYDGDSTNNRPTEWCSYPRPQITDPRDVTWRGIPCVYYGTEMQFKRGAFADIQSASDIERSMTTRGALTSAMSSIKPRPTLFTSTLKNSTRFVALSQPCKKARGNGAEMQAQTASAIFVALKQAKPSLVWRKMELQPSILRA